MHCTFIFTCIMTMISNFSIIYNSQKFFEESYSTNKHTFVFLCDSISFLRNGNIFFFLNSVYFLRALLKNHRTFSHNLFHDINMFVFHMIKSPNCWYWISARNVLAYFCCWRIFWIFSHPSIFLVNDSISA